MDSSNPSLFQSISALPENIQNKFTLVQVLQFASYIAAVRDEIIMVLPTNVDPTATPIELTPVFYTFLAGACAVEYNDVAELWKALGRHIWPHCDAILQCPSPGAFKEHGHPLGFTGKSLYPPTNTCTNVQCSRFQQGLTMGKVEQRNAVLFTLGQGAIPVHSVHKYCEGKLSCNVNYHHNFSVHQGQRTYYQEIPEILQIGEHQFAEVRLINLWTTTMLVAWSSASNCARWYNESLAHTAAGVPDYPDWQFKLEVSSDQVYNGFTILSLLEDCDRRKEALNVPHTGDDKDRFREAVRIRNDRVRAYGLGQHHHTCSKCTRILKQGINLVHMFPDTY
ncbi:hypothetical protein NMY22_g19532 [Coprinellus aureogranulatus]|nr:hypothetical protein NMY22_g19532 [Coprinellus aureogranulatus]